MSDIERFNWLYLITFRAHALMDICTACQVFGAEKELVGILVNANESELRRLVTDDCTLIRQNFSTSILERSVGRTQDSPLSDLHELNYKYLMLVRHIASKSIREAMLRTGVEYGAAEKLSKLSEFDIKELSRQEVCMGGCHLTKRAFKTATAAEFSLPDFITMFSIRSAPCAAL